MSRSILLAEATHGVEVKQSRFLASARAVASPDAAMDALSDLSIADATHNGWAWRIGEAFRSGDDHEVAGTAGRPILAAIDGQGFDRVIVVVTRWYGGTKLGVGGLVRAYGGAAAECLRRAQRAPLVEFERLVVHAGFDDIGHVHIALAAFDARKLDESFDALGATLTIRLPANRVDALKLQLRDTTRNRVRVDDNG